MSLIFGKIKGIVPILDWLPKRPRKYLAQDVVSSLTVTPFVIPQALAYGTLAGLAPQYGLYTSLLPPLVFSIFGSSPHVNIGVFAVISILLKSGVDGVMTYLNLETADEHSQSILEARVQLAMCITFMVGILGMVMSAFRVGGRVVKIMNEYTINSLTCGASFHIGTSQFKEFLGIRHYAAHVAAVEEALNLRQSTVFGFGVQWAAIARAFKMGDVHLPTVIFGFSVLLAVIAFKIADKKAKAWALSDTQNPVDGDLSNYRQLPADNVDHSLVQQTAASNQSPQSGSNLKSQLVKKLRQMVKLPLPEVFIVIILCIIVVYAGNLSKDPIHIKIVGHIPSGMPPFILPWSMDRVCALLNVCNLGSIYAHLIVPVIVLFTAAFLLATSIIVFYQENGVVEREMDLNQDWLALSLCSLFGSFCSAFVPTASLARTAIVNDSYKSTPPSQLLSIFSVIMIVIVLYTLTQTLAYIPYCALSAIILESMRKIFGQMTKGLNLLRDRPKSADTFIWWMTFLAIVLINLEYGLLIGFTLSIGDKLRIYFQSSKNSPTAGDYYDQIVDHQVDSNMNDDEDAESDVLIGVEEDSSPLQEINHDLFVQQSK
ncbi:hypothetical protein MP228_004495 [Amoeboaphelidium protococcarum]|nr:hypothetical protein MP228_004495 [Amoeboaphelidium protococcarum]